MDDQTTRTTVLSTSGLNLILEDLSIEPHLNASLVVRLQPRSPKIYSLFT